MSATTSHDLRKEILKHVLENPEGMDTFEGIARFWVLRQRIDVQIAEVEKTLEELVREELLSKRELHDVDGRTVKSLYQVNPDRVSEIRVLLNPHENF